MFDYSAGCASTLLTLKYGLLASAVYLAVYFLLKFVVVGRSSKRERVQQLVDEMDKIQRKRRTRE